MAAVIMSRDLYLESVVLLMTALLYIYVFLTDQNHKVPMIKIQDKKDEDDKTKKKKKKQ